MCLTHSGYNYHMENQLPNPTKFVEDYSLNCVQREIKLMILLRIKSFLHNSLAMLKDGLNTPKDTYYISKVFFFLN